MTNEHDHPADGPEQEITSESPEFAAEMAESTVEGRKGKVTDPLAAAGADSEEDSHVESGEDAPARAEGRSDEREAPRKLERLQKILAQSGVASRRHAEELITGGRVQVNGQTVTVLGTKADPERDHIRVDDKLLRGAERHRYFMLNKPRGYVTTVTDPEGRPTVMEFFAKSNERLYPVGRLDFQSEGLLLVTNDGELANQLTRAASGVEKTYLVKVAGKPGEDELERLRSGVAIDKGRPREGKVHTAPAQIRQVRKGDNPWFEVVLIEGRNRELRKMFEEIGHHVEKIRRVGYGPLVLDVEPGKIRELHGKEIEALRMTAAGKLKPRKIKTSNMLPKDAGKRADAVEGKPRRMAPSAGGESAGSQFERSDERQGSPRPQFGARPPGRFEKSDRSAPRRPGGDRTFSSRPSTGRSGTGRPSSGRPSNDRPSTGRPGSDRPFRGTSDRREGFVRRDASAAPRRESFARPTPGQRTGEPVSRPFTDRTAGDRKPGGREEFRGRSGPPRKFVPNRAGGDRPFRDRPGSDRPASSARPFPAASGRPFKDRPAGDRPRSDRPGRGSGDRRESFGRKEPSAEPSREQFKRPAPSRLSIEPTSRPFEDSKPTERQAGERKPGGRGEFRGRSGPPRKPFGGPPRGARDDRGGERTQRPTEFRGGRKPSGEGAQRRESSPRPFRPERSSGGPSGARSSERSGARSGERPAPSRSTSGERPAQRERPSRPFSGDRKPGASSFRGKPGSKSGGKPGFKPGSKAGGGKTKRSSSPRPGGKRTFGKKSR